MAMETIGTDLGKWIGPERRAIMQQFLHYILM